RRPEVPPWARGEIARFHAHVLYELLGLRELVFATAADEVGRALRLCLSSILVKFMKAGPEAPRDGEAKRIARGVPSRMLADRAAELARGLAALERRAPPGTPAPKIEEADARALPIPGGAAALVLSSPPYAGTYDYAAQHETRFVWLGLSAREFRRVQLGARAGAVGNASAGVWRADAARFIAEIARVLRPGGHALLMVGDGVLDGRPEHAPDSVAEASAAPARGPVDPGEPRSTFKEGGADEKSPVSGRAGPCGARRAARADGDRGNDDPDGGHRHPRRAARLPALPGRAGASRVSHARPRIADAGDGAGAFRLRRGGRRAVLVPGAADEHRARPGVRSGALDFHADRAGPLGLRLAGVRPRPRLPVGGALHADPAPFLRRGAGLAGGARRGLAPRHVRRDRPAPCSLKRCQASPKPAIGSCGGSSPR